MTFLSFILSVLCVTSYNISVNQSYNLNTDLLLSVCAHDSAFPLALFLMTILCIQHIRIVIIMNDIILHAPHL